MRGTKVADAIKVNSGEARMCLSEPPIAAIRASNLEGRR